MGTPNFGEVDPSLFKYSTSRMTDALHLLFSFPLILLPAYTHLAALMLDKFYLATVSSAG